MVAARMNVETGRTVAMLVSRPFQVENRSTDPESRICRVARFALGDKLDLRREILNVSAADKSVKMFVRDVRKKMKLADIRMIGFWHAQVHWNLLLTFINHKVDKCQSGD